MDLLEKFWEGTTNTINGVLGGIDRGLTTFFGSANSRQIKRYTLQAQQVGLLEPRMIAMSDGELRDQTDKFKQRLSDGETIEDILVEAFATCREAGRRFMKMRHYDVQLIGGMVLNGGNIAEMITGEGKTLVATLPTYLNALEGRGVHVVTVNDYLARRDMEWMAPLYMGLGLTVGNIQSGMDNDERQKSYACDITYATNNELGFDYLRDNMRMASRGDNRFPAHMQQVQGPLHYAVIDEVDNILIDEARTPLIISGSAARDLAKYSEADRVAKALKKEEHFVVNEKDHTVNLTDAGIRDAEKLAGVESFYTVGNMEWPHLLDNALKAHHLYKRDVNYVVKEGAIIIVDEFTGRLMDGRQWSDGLHQAVEAKEGVRIKEETQTLATITLQNFFKLYKKISGMTGTAMTEASEFSKIYNLGVTAIPSNRGLQRIEFPDSIYLTEKEKYAAVADEIERVHKYDTLHFKDRKRGFVIGTIQSEDETSIKIKKSDSKEVEQIAVADVEKIDRFSRPILVGTVSIEKSERLSKLLDQRGVTHEVLNAKQHKREAEIIAQAGRRKSVTIATNMAGRGTDIILGGNADTMAWAQLQDKYPTRLEVPKEEWDALVHEIDQREKMKEEGERVRELGGLYVVATERHESRRIDLQLRGRCGRQGDPGSSRFYLSLEDDLMRIFAGEWVREWMKRMGMGEGDAIESPYVSKRISGAQKKVEERNFEARKSLLEYDEVMDYQRKKVYGYRQQILDGTSCRDLVMFQLRQQIEKNVTQFCDPMFGPDSYAKWAGSKLGVELEPKDFRGVDPATAVAYAKDKAERTAETQILDALDENMPTEEEPSEWNWEAMAKWVNSRFGANYTVGMLRKIDRDRMDEELIGQSQKYIAGIDLSEGDAFLREEFGLKMLVGWMKNKFGIEIALEEVRGPETEQLAEKLLAKAEETYIERESQFPIMVSFSRFQQQTGPNNYSIDGGALAEWASTRFEDPTVLEQLQAESDKSTETLVAVSRRSVEKAIELRKTAVEKAESIFGKSSKSLKDVLGNSATEIETVAEWMRKTIGWTGEAQELKNLNKTELNNKFMQSIDDRYFPEIRRMERTVLLTQLDSAWKDHLLAMDHVRSSVNFRSMGQMDPKVEYKREGMKLFEDMWLSIGERMTDVIFRMEAMDSDIVSDSWVENKSVARHDSYDATSQLLAEKEADLASADAAGAEPQRIEAIRNRGDRLGRNDPCTCGSGKKYKNCCMRKQV
ncbi:MAG: SEC-C metal-binding domain-containing protein [Planctomycetota bacterium]|nr:SEC-C metal-binding domain-containing protein [Planctomycetota bacterium]